MSGNVEIEVLLQIAKGNSDLPFATGEADMENLIRLAVRHKVLYQLLRFAQQHKDDFTTDQFSRIETRCRRSAQRSLTLLHEMKRIAETLNEKQVKFVCIKGPQLSRMIYGREALKDSVDLDIMLVYEKDLKVVHVILTDLGYNWSNLNDFPGKLRRKIFLIAKREIAYFNKEFTCAVDLHIRPGANTYLSAKYFKGFFSGLRTDDLEGTPIPVLPDEAYFVYLCYHGALHQFSRLAWLMDIRAFLKLKNSDLDQKQLISLAKSLRVERCVSLAGLLLKTYFGEEYAAADYRVSIRIRLLASFCRRMLGRRAEYGLTLRGRIGKIMYMMLLIKGVSGKIDWLYGVFMRQMMKVVVKHPGSGTPSA